MERGYTDRFCSFWKVRRVPKNIKDAYIEKKSESRLLPTLAEKKWSVRFWTAIDNKSNFIIIDTIMLYDLTK